MGTIAKGEITLSPVNDAYTVLLTPSSCSISADFDGSNPSLDNAKGTITVKRGTKTVPFKVNSVTYSASGVQASWLTKEVTEMPFAITNIPNTVLDGYIKFRIATQDGFDYSTEVQFSFNIVRESTMLDWIQEWEGSKTKVGGTYIMTPKLFVGKKETVLDTTGSEPAWREGALTGIYLGPDLLASGESSIGIYGYLRDKEIFHINGDGGFIGGWTFNDGGLQSANGVVSILSEGSIYAQNPNSETPYWGIYADGTAQFANGNVKFLSDGSAEFSGKITSASGTMGGWTITQNQLHSGRILLDSSEGFIGINASQIQNVDTLTGDYIFPETPDGGLKLWYSSATDFGMAGWATGEKVFQLGSTNFIAGWSFNHQAIWSGTAVPHLTQGSYTTDSGSITIATNGIRSNKWYVDANGTAAFVGGKVRFGTDNAEMFGWLLRNSRLSSSHAALANESSYCGLFVSPADLSEVGTSSLAVTVGSNGGIYLYSDSINSIMKAYDKNGNMGFYLSTTGFNQIGNWQFNHQAIYIGSQNVSSEGFASTSGSMILATSGIVGYKWKLNSDGSGAVAGGNIAWDVNGNLSFDSSVTAMWENGINVAQMIAFGQMLYRDPEFTQDKTNGTALYQNDHVDYVTFSAGLALSTIQNYGLHLRGNALIKRIDVINSSGDVSTAWTGSQSLNPTTACAWQDIMPTITSSDTIRISFQMEDAQIQVGVMSDANTYTSWINLCGYTSNSGTAVIHTKRILVSDTTAPNSTQTVVQYTCTRWNAVGDYRLGGFCFANQSRANAKFVVKIVAKIPVGWMIENYHDSYGTGASTTWVTSQEGAGSYAEYICIVKCGSIGTFSAINHFSLKCNSTYTAVAATDAYSLDIQRTNVNTGATETLESVVWSVAYATVFDATSSDKVTTTIDKNGIYTGTLRADQIVAGTIDATQINADVILSNGDAWALNKDGSGYLANKNISWDANGNTSFSGKIIATSGSIGDIEIYSDHIGVTSNSTDTGDSSWASLSIYKDFLKVGGSKGYVMFGNDVIPATAGGAFTAVGRIVNQAANTYGSYGFDQANYGLFIDVTGGTKNYGISSNAALMAPAFINTKAKLLTFSGGTYTVDFSQNNIILMYYNESGYSGTTVTLPEESSVASKFGLSSLPDDFATVVVFRVRTGSLPITLKGIYDHNENQTDYKLSSGDSVIVLISKCDGFRYQILNHSS